MSVMRTAMGVKWGLFAPRRAMEIGAFFLRTEAELPLKSRRVVSRRVLEAGFGFEFPRWSEGARDIVRAAASQPQGATAV